jgi:dATP/dGTP diphosphohydrolase, N-terminal
MPYPENDWGLGRGPWSCGCGVESDTGGGPGLREHEALEHEGRRYPDLLERAMRETLEKSITADGCNAVIDIGRKDDADKTRFDLIPPIAEKLVADALTYGAKRYGAENWRKVDFARERYEAAWRRHLNAWKRGEELDKESGLPHLALAICSLMFVLELESVDDKLRSPPGAK